MNGIQTIYIVITYFYTKILLAYTCVGVDNLWFVFRTFGFIKPIAAPLCYFLSPFLAPTSISLLSPKSLSSVTFLNSLPCLNLRSHCLCCRGFTSLLILLLGPGNKNKAWDQLTKRDLNSNPPKKGGKITTISANHWSIGISITFGFISFYNSE